MTRAEKSAPAEAGARIRSYLLEESLVIYSAGTLSVFSAVGLAYSDSPCVGRTPNPRQFGPA